MGKIKIFKGRDNQYYYSVIAANGEPLVVSEGFTTKQNCKKGINSLMENIKNDINIIDETKN
jgi:uncharacterized protein YegP (UPF0339 family)